MNDDRLEQLLRGYRLPATPPAFDTRVLAQAEGALAAARASRAAAGIARGVGDALGFGYLNFLIDFVTATDADYDVELA
jgi:hypothetical protein